MVEGRHPGQRGFTDCDAGHTLNRNGIARFGYVPPVGRTRSPEKVRGTYSELGELNSGLIEFSSRT